MMSLNIYTEFFVFWLTNSPLFSSKLNHQKYQTSEEDKSNMMIVLSS